MEEKIIRNSADWNRHDTYRILDPDGWDRTNFRFSWFVELIDQNEYIRRRNKSTTSHKSDMVSDRILSMIAELNALYVDLDEKHENIFKAGLRTLNASFGPEDVNHEKQLLDWAEKKRSHNASYAAGVADAKAEIRKVLGISDAV